MGKKNGVSESLTMEEWQMVNGIAMSLYDTFYRKLHARFGHPWPRHRYAGDRRHWMSSFIPTALVCHAEKWDPEEYAGFVIDRLSTNHRYIRPDCLRKPEARDGYRAASLTRQTGFNAQSEWEYLVRSLIVCISETNSTEERVLLSPLFPFPAWFRVVYPERLGDELFALYGAGARKEFAESGQLRAFVRKMTPKTFAALEARWGGFGDITEADK